MNWLLLTITLGTIFLTHLLGIGTIVQPVWASPNKLIAQQQSPASTYQPGFWQPVDRVNPNNPITVNINNQSGIVIEYSLTTSPLGTRSLAENGNTQLTNLPIDSYIIVNPQSSSAPIQLSLMADNNIVNLTVQRSSDFSGQSTVHLHSTGAIYIY